MQKTFQILTFFVGQQVVRENNPSEAPSPRGAKGGVFPLFLFLSVFLFLLPVVTKAALGPGLSKGSLTVPDSNLSDWTKAGVEGGIPDTSNATLWPVINTDTDTVGSCTPFTSAEKSDTADDHLKIQCYVDYARTLSGVGGRLGTVVKLGAGTFRIGITPLHGSSVVMKSNVVLRGSGQFSTTISGEWGAVYWITGIGGWGMIHFVGSYVGSDVSVTDSSIPSGATTLTVSDASTFAVGDWVKLNQTNDPAYIDNMDGGGPYMTHLFRVTFKQGNVLTMDRPLRHAFNPAMSPVVREITPTSNAGLESLKVMQDEATPDLYSPNILFMLAVNSWVRDVYLYNGIHHHINIGNSRGIQIESNRLERLLYAVYASPADRPYGNYSIELGRGAEDSKVTNNIFRDTYIQLVISRGASGNVFSYNYITASPDAISHGLLFHGHYPHHNLIEGNDTDQVISIDEYWGRQGPGNVSYRNRLRNDILSGGVRGWMRNERTGGSDSILMPQWTVINTSAYAWFAAPWCNYPGCPAYLTRTVDAWIERNTFRDPVIAVNRGFVNVSPPASAHVDNVVLANTTPPTWPGFTFPASFYATSKPSWWCDETPWPAIGANVDDFTNNPANLVKLPAQRRHEGLICTTSGGTPTDNPPTISLSISSPTVTVNTPVTFSATANDDHGVSGVQFYVGGVAQGAEDTSSPYSLSYSPTVVGTYSITARARDTIGQTTTSDPVSLSVNPAPPANLCGNNTIDSGEQCDGANLNGQTCFSLNQGFTGGTLSCSSSCTFLTTSCTSGSGTLILGNNTIGTSITSGNSNNLSAVRFTTGSQGGTTQSISVYVVSPISASPNNQYSLAVYSNSGTTPGTLITNTNNGTLIGNAWNTLPITTTLLPNTTYWLVYNTNGTASTQNNYRYNTGGTQGQGVWRGGQPFGVWPSTYGTPTGNAAVIPSIYLTYTIGTPPSDSLSSLTFFFTTDTNFSLGGKAITVSILPQGSTKTTPALETQSPTASSYLNNTNQVTLPTTGRTSGTYDIQIKAPGNLSRKQTFTLSSGSSNTFSNKLISGDINIVGNTIGDNSINSLDWSVMSSEWFQTGKSSDINGDGITNALDFTWLNRNWFLTGE